MLKAISQGAALSPLGLLLNPTFWLVICVWTAITAVYSADLGAERERLKQTEITAKALQQQVEANDRVLARERKLRADDAAEFIKFKETQEHANKTHRQLVADLSSGHRRLRVPTSSLCRPAPDGGSTPATGIVETRYADIDPGISLDLLALTERGDEAIRKHATLVDMYDNLRLACTAPDAPTIAP